MPDQTFELSVPAHPDFVRIVRMVVAGIGNAMAMDVEQIDDLKTAVGEAYTMFHPSLESPLRVRTSCNDDELSIEVIQQFEAGAPRLLAMDNSMERGLAIVLLNHLMDRVEYLSDAQHKRFKLTKFRRNGGAH
ncbi:MAG: ATP-binding protein [Armatimonadetes bacterium]|nr:ATP-binding protein [Armatimonadota bacterium]